MKDFIRLLEFFKPYKVRLVAAFIFSGLVAALTGAYAWLVRPVLDGIFIDKDTFLLNVLPLAILAVAVMKAAFSYGQNYLMNYANVYFSSSCGCRSAFTIRIRPADWCPG